MISPAVKRRRSSKWWYVPAVIALVAIIGVSWYQLELKAVGPGANVVFVVKPGQTGPEVAKDLVNAHLIRSKNAFITYLNFHGLRTKIKAGSYSLTPSESSRRIAIGITTSSGLGQLVVPEGYTITQIETAAATRGISKTSFEAALAESHAQAGLSSKPAGVGLEGYLFPDTYEATPGVTNASTLVNAMLADFTTKVGTIYDTDFAAQGLTRHQGLTLASVIEREVNRPEDRPIVAQVFLKRLKEGIPLGSDVTVNYAASLLNTTFSTTLNSPYNTYLYKGLPPGPICNPGLSALDAVAHPASTDYLYFVAGSDGVTHFSTTYAEHQKNVAKYLK